MAEPITRIFRTRGGAFWLPKVSGLLFKIDTRSWKLDFYPCSVSTFMLPVTFRSSLQQLVCEDIDRCSIRLSPFKKNVMKLHAFCKWFF